MRFVVRTVFEWYVEADDVQDGWEQMIEGEDDLRDSFGTDRVMSNMAQVKDEAFTPRRRAGD